MTGPLTNHDYPYNKNSVSFNSDGKWAIMLLIK